jgi:hypothetical protein
MVMTHPPTRANGLDRAAEHLVQERLEAVDGVEADVISSSNGATCPTAALPHESRPPLMYPNGQHLGSIRGNPKRARSPESAKRVSAWI